MKNLGLLLFVKICFLWLFLSEAKPPDDYSSTFSCAFLFPFMAASHPDSVGVPCTFQLLNPCHSLRGIPDCGFWLVIICLAFKLNLSMSASDIVVNFCCYFYIETTDILIYFGLFIELCFLSVHPVRLCKHKSRVIVTKCSIHCSQSLERGLFIAHWTLTHAHFSMRNAFPHKPAFDSVERKIAEWSFAVKVFSTSVVLCV